MSGRANVNSLRLTLVERGDGLMLRYTYRYTGSLPRKPQREKAVAEMLRRALTGMEGRGAEYVGSAEESNERVRRDEWTIEEAKA